MPKFVLLWTDAAIWLLLAAFAAYAAMVYRNANLRATWTKVFQNGAALSASIVLVLSLLVTLADSLHYRPLLPSAGDGATAAYDTRVKSALDALMARTAEARESTYSVPLAYVGFTKESVKVNDEVVRTAPRLLHGGAHLKDPATEWLGDVLSRVASGLGGGLAATVVLLGIGLALVARGQGGDVSATLKAITGRQTRVPWHVAGWTVTVLCLVIGPVVALTGHYHVFGTDITGNDVLYQTLKSIRTAFVIGSLATLATLPLAVTLGIMAGYFKGWVDELIQYVYTVLSSIPNILLIAACVLMVQVFLDKHPELFETGVERADLKLFLLCMVLGVTGWAGLCRLLRGETLKLRELEYVQAANAFGVGH